VALAGALLALVFLPARATGAADAVEAAEETTAGREVLQT
jgi:hypothetical protein